MESKPTLDPLKLAQARWLVGDLMSDELANVAVDLIQRGYECAAFWEIARTMNRDLSADGPALFDRAMQELGLATLSDDDAALMVARHAATECLAGRITPEEFATKAFGVARNAHYPEKLADVVGLHDEYQEGWGSRRRDLDQATREAAVRLLS